MAHFDGSSHINIEEMRIVMVGKSGSGKSATGNTILGRECFVSKVSPNSVTEFCSKGHGVISGQRVSVTDTPGFFDTRFDKEKTTTDITQCISYACPGPHIFLVIIKLGRHTEEEKKTVQQIQEIFGKAADKYSMVLFTGGDLLEGSSIEDFVAKSSDLQELVARCNHQYHIFNNKTKDPSQVTELFQKIRDIVQKNGGSHYTNDMFREAERLIKVEQERILKEKEEKIRREQEKVEQKLKAQFDKEMEKIRKQIQAEAERERKEREREREVLHEEIRRGKEQRAEELRREREGREWELARVKGMYERELRMGEEREAERERKWAERERAERAERNEEAQREFNRLKDSFVREVREARNDVQAKYVTQARTEAETLNPIKLFIEKVTGRVANRVGELISLFSKHFSK